MRFQPLIRAGTLSSYLEFARTLDLDAKRLLREVGLHRFDLSDVDARIPSNAVIALLERSAEAAGVEDFGLRLANQRSFAHLGPIALLLREQPTAGHALQITDHYLRRYNKALAVRLINHHNFTMLIVQVLSNSGGRTRQATEFFVGTVHRMLSLLVGAVWTAESVNFTHPAAATHTVHNQIFKTRTIFDSTFNGFMLRASDLAIPVRTADVAIPRYAKRFVEEVFPDPVVSPDAAVRQIVFELLPLGRCSCEAVARRLGVERKTVSRRLSLCGATYSAIVRDVRVELARRYIRTERRSLTDAAQLLGFSSLATFSRWFRTEFGTSASCWRRTSTDRAGKSGQAKLQF